jgi:integrase
MKALNPIRAAVDEYLLLRRKLGFALLVEGQELGRFARFAEQIGYKGPITTAVAVQWATQPTEASRIYHARRLDMVRRLARHVAVLDPATEIPPEGLLGPSYRRREPHIYSADEITALMRCAAQLGPAGGLRPLTYTVLFGLLASTGMRISEALGLAREDVNLDAAIITVAKGKFHRSRLVPLDPTTVQVLRSYVSRRDRHKWQPSSDRFFVSERGTSLKYHKVIMTFTELRNRLGWKHRPSGRSPRIHDLRHSFAVGRMLRWYEQGLDIDRNIARLSTYLGHVKVSDTYWYLTAVPELVAIAAARFEGFSVRLDREENR